MNNVIVLDLETLRSADDCRHCGEPQTEHIANHPTEHTKCTEFTPIGWSNKPALGLSIGGYYSYADGRIRWFDEHNLDETMTQLVEQQALMVSFNGIQFDFPLMRGILRRRCDGVDFDGLEALRLSVLCDAFKVLAADSYDILAEIWRADPSRRFEKGLNSLDAIAQANGLGPKLSHGAQAPRDWAAGRHANVINYCQDDILKTKALFEKLTFWEGSLTRGDGKTIDIRWIDNNNQWRDPSDMPF